VSMLMILFAAYMGCASLILWLGFFHPRRPAFLFADAPRSARVGAVSALSGFLLMQIGL